MDSNLKEIYGEYASSRLTGGFGEMGSWPLVLPYLVNKKVLDIGCSDGLYLKHLSKNSVGIEQVEKLAESGIGGGLTIVNSSVDEGLIVQDSSSFDGVLFSHVMEHVDGPILVLKQINRILRLNGTLVLGLPIENCFSRHLLRNDYYNGTHLYGFTIKNSKKLLSLTGFEVDEVVYHLPRTKGELGHKINKLWNQMPLPFKEYFSSAYWVCATKKRELD